MTSKRLLTETRLRLPAVADAIPPGGTEIGDQPMDQPRPSHLSQVSCGAKTKAGTRCQSAPIEGRTRCRLHGGLSPGAPRGAQNGNYTNGEWTAEAIEERKWLRWLVSAFAGKDVL